METDGYGNVKCPKCKKFYAESFEECPNCCSHDELELDEEWQGDDDTGGWGVSFVCSRCGKNYDWDRDYIINHYKLVRKEK